MRARVWVVAGEGAAALREPVAACGSEEGLPDSAFCSASSPLFHRPCQGLCPLTKMGSSLLAHPFVVASSVLARGVRRLRVIGRPWGGARQVVSICGGSGGDSPDSCRHEGPCVQVRPTAHAPSAHMARACSLYWQPEPPSPRLSALLPPLRLKSGPMT